MRRGSLALAAAILAVTPALGADFEQKWEQTGALHAGGFAAVQLGYLMFDPDNVDIDRPNRFTAGGLGSYAAPLSDRASVQFDALGEVTINPEDDSDETLFEGTLGAHINWRDPASHLFGAFGGGGISVDGGDNDGPSIPFVFAGIEGQAYFGRATLQGQVGFLDGDDAWLETIENAAFARVVGRYYLSDATRLSAELSYLHGGRPNNDPESGGVIDIFGWGARVDHLFGSHGFALNLAYNGYDYRPTEETDAPWVHEFRVGLTKYFGSPSIMANDRSAAGLDLPPVARWISTSTNEIE